MRHLASLTLLASTLASPLAFANNAAQPAITLTPMAESAAAPAKAEAPLPEVPVAAAPVTAAPPASETALPPGTQVLVPPAGLEVVPTVPAPITAQGATAEPAIQTAEPQAPPAEATPAPEAAPPQAAEAEPVKKDFSGRRKKKAEAEAAAKAAKAAEAKSAPALPAIPETPKAEAPAAEAPPAATPAAVTPPAEAPKAEAAKEAPTATLATQSTMVQPLVQLVTEPAPSTATPAVSPPAAASAKAAANAPQIILTPDPAAQQMSQQASQQKAAAPATPAPAQAQLQAQPIVKMGANPHPEITPPVIITTPSVSLPSSGTYVLDRSHATLSFKINHLGFSNYVGRFDKFDAKLVFDATNPTKSKVVASIDPTSINTNHEELEGKLVGSDYLNTSKYKKLTFISRQVGVTGAKSGIVAGDLNLHGITKPVAFEVTLMGHGMGAYSGAETIGFTATGKLKRSDFGIDTLLPKVGDEVTFTFDGEFLKVPPEDSSAPGQ